MKWSGEIRSEYIVPLADDVFQIHCLGGREPEPIVRCDDCKWVRKLAGVLFCTENSLFHCKTEARGFCWKGERE